MNKLKIVVCVITILILCTNAYADNPSAEEILKNVAATYNSMKTYKVEGNINIEDVTNTSKSLVNYSFSILMKKPDLYLITWEPINPPRRHENFYAVWNNGTEPYSQYRSNYAHYKIASNEKILSEIKGNHGPFNIFPQLFLPVFKGQEAPFAWLKNPKVEKIEKIGEEECYVITGSSDMARREIIWISKKGYLIRKYSNFRDYTNLANIYKQVPGYYDEKYIKKKVEESKRNESTTLYTEVYTEISSPELNKEDFNYTLPEGAELRDKHDD
jgi:hypothetical protein